MSDYEEIRNAMAWYTRVIDDHEFEKLDRIFDEETIYVMSTGEVRGLGAAIQALHKVLSTGVPHRRHVYMNTAVELGGDRATATSDWYVLGPNADGGWNVLNAGRYNDEFQRKNGRWMFAARRIALAPR